MSRERELQISEKNNKIKVNEVSERNTKKEVPNPALLATLKSSKHGKIAGYKICLATKWLIILSNICWLNISLFLGSYITNLWYGPTIYFSFFKVL